MGGHPPTPPDPSGSYPTLTAQVEKLRRVKTGSVYAMVIQTRQLSNKFAAIVVSCLVAGADV